MPAPNSDWSRSALAAVGYHAVDATSARSHICLHVTWALTDAMPLAHLPPIERHPLVFLTVCTAKRTALLNSEVAHSILRTLWQQSAEHNDWWVGRYVLMPDHIHLFAMPGVKADSMQKWIAQWKSISARRIATVLGARGPIWQRDYFDRYLRTAESYQAKWDYVRNNPIRANLVTAQEHWPYQGEIHELRK